jgi:hypothetical protein
MAEVENAAPEGGDHLSKVERAYFETRGEQAIPSEPEAPPSPPAAEPAEPAPTPTQAEAPPVDTKEKEERKVDYGALAEERAKRKESEAKLREMELQQARMEERFRAWQEGQRPQQQAPKPPPRADQDIFGAVTHLQKEQERTARELQEYRQRAAVEQQTVEMIRAAQAAESEFKKATPDYDQALAFLRDSRKAELATWGMQGAAVEQQLVNEERQLIARARQDKRSPAEMAYGLAKLRGYNAKAAQSDPADKLDRIEAGQKQARSMSGTGGSGATGNDISGMDLLKMPDAEYQAWKAKNPARYRRLMGSDR